MRSVAGISDLADYLAWLPALARRHYDPQYYTRLGWRAVERFSYLERERTVMDYDPGLSSAPNHGMHPAACGRD